MRPQKWTASILLECMRIIRPLLGPVSMCIFAPYSCTAFAQDQLTYRPLYKAIPAIAWRLVMCNPLGAWWLRRYPCDLLVQLPRAQNPLLKHTLLPLR